MSHPSNSGNPSIITEWLNHSNAFDTDKYLALYQPHAVLDHLSVGKKFAGHTGIREYFTDYFIGYETHTRLVKHEVRSNHTFL